MDCWQSAEESRAAHTRSSCDSVGARDMVASRMSLADCDVVVNGSSKARRMSCCRRRERASEDALIAWSGVSIDPFSASGAHMALIRRESTVYASRRS